MKLYKKISKEKIDAIDLRIMNLLVKEREVSKTELMELSKKVGISLNELRRRIVSLKRRRIIIKTNSAIIDPVRLWDEYLIVFIKANLSPPVVGVEIEYPRGWTEIIERIIETQKKLGVNIVRQAYSLQGTEWDLLLVVTTQDLDEYQRFGEELIKQGWVEKVWSMRPFELKGKWIFDPVSIPSEK
ncbi:MAG: Lrp/AsnC family transcriptional regulator [Candidatus Micrarchaeia archaeon]